MSLTTTVGGATSDSFATLTEIEAYLTEFYGEAVPAEWDELSNAQKEYVAQTMAQVIGHYPLRGRRVYLNQVLCFPRTCQTDTTVVPDAVKEVQALLCVRLGIYLLSRILAEDVSEPPIPATGGIIEDVEIGPLSFGLGQSENQVPVPVENLIAQSRFSDLRLRLKPYLASIRGWKVRSQTEIEEDEDDMEEAS